jgi:hypothetical protein
MLNRCSIRALICAVPLTITACSSSPTEPSRSANVTLNASEFVATRLFPESTLPQYQITVITSIRNTGAGPLYLTACGSSPTPVFGVELVSPSNPEGSAFNRAWGCPAGAEHVLAPGAQRTDTLTLRAPSAVQNGRALGAVEGTMRVVFLGTTCRTPDKCSGDAVREVRLPSAPFTVRVP